jgi:hypothetical protein
LAVAIHMMQFKSMDIGAVSLMSSRAQNNRLVLEQQYRAWPDFVGGNPHGTAR